MERLPMLLLLASLVLIAPPAQAQTADPGSPARIVRVSGKLQDADGGALAGPRAVTFALYESQEGGTPLWTEVQTVTANEDGRYAAVLGTNSSLPIELFSREQARWLGVSADGYEQRRMLLVAVPYALKAADTDTLGGIPLADFVMRQGREGASGQNVGADPLVEGTGVPGQLAKFSSPSTLSSSIVTETAASRIGIGTTDPTEGGAVDAKVTIRAGDGMSALATSNAAGVPRFALNNNANGSFSLFDYAGGVSNLGITQKGGRVGIGTADPTSGVVDSRLTIRNQDNNTALGVISETGGRRFALNTASDGSWVLYDGFLSTWNSGLRQRGGRIGIGTSTPASLLEVRGGAFIYQGPSTTQHAVTIVNDGDVSGLFVDNNAGGAGPGLMVRHFADSGVAAQFELEGSLPSGNILIGRHGGLNRFRVDFAGNVFAASYQTGGADFAEAFEPAAPLTVLAPGDVLVISEDRDRAVDLARAPYSTRVAGVYSTQPGILASPYPVDDPRRAEKLPLAVVGVVLCKVSAENGPIARGDLLVTAATAGHAMKGTDRVKLTGAVVGKALQPLPQGTGVILVLVTLQ